MQKSNTFLEQFLDRIDRIDKTALKACVRDLAEEVKLVRKLLNQLVEGVVVAERNGLIMMMNEPASRMLGLEGGGKAVSLFNLEDDEAARFFERHFEKLHSREQSDLHLLQPGENYLRVSLTPLNSGGEDLILVVLLNRNEEMEEQIDFARLARIEALVTLAAGVAHEIGNPLNSLSIHLQLLKKEIDKLPKEKRKTLESSVSVLNAETQRMDRIVRNFLKAARKPPLRFRLENLNALVDEALDFLGPELKRNKIAVSFDSDEKLPEFFMDRDRIHQTFINLIKNAMESMGTGGGRLKIRVRQKEKVASVSFQDEGKGIREKDLPHIFEAYYTTKEEGSGLGLATVFETVHEHGGRIEVKSKPGQGALFTILLPVRQPKLQLPSYKMPDKESK